MELSRESIWLLNDVDLNLCVMMLGRRTAFGFPIRTPERPLRQRMLERFVHLVQMGLLVAAEGGYTPSPLMRERFIPVAFPERTILVTQTDIQTTWAWYQLGSSCTIIQKPGDDAGDYRIWSVGERETRQTLMEVLLSPVRNQENGRQPELICSRIEEQTGSALTWRSEHTRQGMYIVRDNGVGAPVPYTAEEMLRRLLPEGEGHDFD